MPGRAPRRAQPAAQPVRQPGELPVAERAAGGDHRRMVRLPRRGGGEQLVEQRVAGRRRRGVDGGAARQVLGRRQPQAPLAPQLRLVDQPPQQGTVGREHLGDQAGGNSSSTTSQLKVRAPPTSPT